ncbi:hypothetical protein KRR40_16995 [Niabella defluvii]|nr:hypothetical protein KRR40_16995 [Niabella sp. I65]
MKKHIGLLLLLALGFFLAPNLSYACSKTSTKTEKSTCSKKKSKKRAPKQMLVKRTGIMMIVQVNVNRTPAIAAHQHPCLVGSR